VGQEVRSVTAALLVDTCVIIRVVQDSGLAPDTELALSVAARGGQLFVSPISAWEIALKMARNRYRSPLPAIDFFNRFIAISTGRLCELSPEVLALSCSLPLLAHRDPADCILVATARALNMVLVTSDRTILDYGAAGHVKVLAC
jgi:PIN domain nuclease of toxin-antitoxin system